MTFNGSTSGPGANSNDILEHYHSTLDLVVFPQLRSMDIIQKKEFIIQPQLLFM